jgi:hypothetical protein
MPSKVVTTRIAPAAHQRLVALADQRGTSLAAAAARLLEAALEDPESDRPRVDGPLVAAVRTELEDVTAASAVLYREVALHLARSIERREPGHLSAVRQLRDSVRAARSAQETADNPDPFGFDAMGGFSGLLGGL